MNIKEKEVNYTREEYEATLSQSSKDVYEIFARRMSKSIDGHDWDEYSESEQWKYRLQAWFTFNYFMEIYE